MLLVINRYWGRIIIFSDKILNFSVLISASTQNFFGVLDDFQGFWKKRS
jgi:hypothetical protein